MSKKILFLSAALIIGVSFFAGAGFAAAETASALAITKYSGFGDQTVVAGIADAKLGSFTVSAGAAEGVNITSITVALDANEYSSSVLARMYFKDHETGAQLGGVKFSLSASNVYSMTGLALGASAVKVIDLYGDIKSAANAGAWQAKISAIGIGASTGNSISAPAVDIQTITIVSSGALTAAKGNMPVSAILIAGSTNDHVAQYTFSASGEGFTIDKLRLKTQKDFAASIAGVTIKYTDKNGAAKQADGVFIAGSDTYAAATFTGLTIYAPANGSASINVYLNVASIAEGAISGASGAISLSLNESFNATGDSGAAITSAGSADLTGNNFTVSALSTQPSVTVLSPKRWDAWQVGQTYTIQWKGVSSGNYSVYLSGISDFETGYPKMIGSTNFTGSSDSIVSISYIPTSVNISGSGGSRVIIVCPSSQATNSSQCGYSAPFTITAPNSSLQVSADLVSANSDYAGIWGVFAPDGNPDWGWNVGIKNLNAPVSISSVAIISNAAGEGWSTSRDASLLGKQLYPLVVYASAADGGKQLNTAYDQQINITQGLTAYNEFRVYGQTSSKTWPGGKIIITFTDGAQATAAIPASSIAPVSTYPKTPVQSSIIISIIQADAVNTSFNIKWQTNGSYDCTVIYSLKDGNLDDDVLTTTRDKNDYIFGSNFPTASSNGAYYYNLLVKNQGDDAKFFQGNQAYYEIICYDANRNKKVSSVYSFNLASSSQPALSASLLNSFEDRAGLWNNFGPGAGNINKNPADWNWTATLTLPSEKTIARMTLIHNTGGELWSTGYSRYLKDGTDLFGREEHPYPLVVFSEKQNQLNSSYDQTLGAYGAGTNSTFILYGQPESAQFAGGKLIVEFTDGTSVSAKIMASDYRPSVTTTAPISIEVKEQVKCVFKGSASEQKCYIATDNSRPYPNYRCGGTETCVIDLEGKSGDKLTWKSSCGGYAYTVMDGASEYAIFDCASSTAATPTATTPTVSQSSSEQISDINEKSKLLSYGNFDYILAELNQLRNTVKEQQNEIKYLKSMTNDLKNVSEQMKSAINNFITYGVDANTVKLGAGERAAVMNSYKAAFDKLPETEAELADAIKIANGRWPSITNQDAENQAKAQFLKIYKRAADMNGANDNAAVTIMAYGLRQKAENRNLNSEVNGIKIFKAIYGHTPKTTEEWNTMQAITYSGATQKTWSGYNPNGN